MQGLGEVLFCDVTGRMVDHPWRATGPSITFPVSGSQPMKLQAGSCMRSMSKSEARLFSSWMVICFLCCVLSWAILIGLVVVWGRSDIGHGIWRVCKAVLVLCSSFIGVEGFAAIAGGGVRWMVLWF